MGKKKCSEPCTCQTRPTKLVNPWGSVNSMPLITNPRVYHNTLKKFYSKSIVHLCLPKIMFILYVLSEDPQFCSTIECLNDYSGFQSAFGFIKI